MKILCLYFVLIFSAQQLWAQDNYFQQQVNYDIKAKLIDSSHILEAEQRITYINNSPDALEKIYFHLWANAYKDNSTAFARQQLQLHKTDFYFSDESERGGYRSIGFSNNGQSLEFEEYESHADIVTVKLPRPLEAGDTVEIHIDFSLEIPKSFSRLGRTEGAYQLTQWYPKPAVYDQEGWHPMPYLDQGEFYSEFGNYKVEITLPRKYIVAATGTLQNQEERDLLLAKAAELQGLKDIAKLKKKLRDTVQEETPEGTKTLKYNAFQVHDFAIFADQDFQLQYRRALVPGGDSIDVWAFFTPRQAGMWLGALDYLERSVDFYSNELGPYPYPQVTAVEGALSAGAGMEYPMITIIPRAENDRSLDEVITHEVGHNWWYGILASNERKYPWIDEGINSYYEKLYMEKYYPPSRDRLNEFIDKGMPDEGRWIWEVQAQKHQDQAPGLHSEAFTEINYYLGAYWKPAESFLYLSEYIGRNRLRNTMRSFYEKYKFRHFGPDDIRSHLEKELREDLSWLFDGLINSDQEINYSISSIKKKRRSWELRIKNKGNVKAPLSIGGFAADSAFVDRWLEGFDGEAALRLRDRDGLEAIKINVKEDLPEFKLGDNLKRVEGDKVKWKPLKLGLLAGLHYPYQQNLFITPAIGYNAYDGFQIGLWVHNIGVPSKSFEFSVLPNLGIASDQLTGMADARYRWFFNSEAGGIHHLDIGLGLRNYSYSESEIYGYRDRYLKVAPHVALHFRASPLSYYSHNVRYRPVFIEQNYHLGVDAVEGTFTDEYRSYWVHELSYNFEYDHPIRPFEGDAQLEYISGAWRYTAHFSQAFQYQKGNFLEINFFAGGISSYEKSPIDARLYGSGRTGFWLQQRDYKFDYILPGRNQTEGLWSQQIFNRDASLKTLSNIAFSSTFMASMGIEADLPIPFVPIKPYFDIAVYDSQDQLTTAFSSGLSISLFQETLEVFFPIWESQNIRNSLVYSNRPSYFQRVTFSLNLRQWSVFNVKENLNLF